LLGGGGGMGESVENADSPISEDDPYAFRTPKIGNAARFGSDYGMPPITVENDCVKVVGEMLRMVEDYNVEGQDLVNQAQSLAETAIKHLGIRVPRHRFDNAVEQVTSAFFNELDRRVSIGEDQFKWGTIRRRRNPRRASLGKTERKGVRAESKEPNRTNIVWVEQQTDAAKGILNNTPFIFDHGGDSGLEPVILSEDGLTEVPIPPDVHTSALAAAGIGPGNPEVFVEWLESNLEQLHPVAEEEDNNINEAIARITASADGEISVEVDPGVPVATTTGVPGEEGMGDTMGMEPVETMPDGESDMPIGDEGGEGDIDPIDFEGEGEEGEGGLDMNGDAPGGEEGPAGEIGDEGGDEGGSPPPPPKPKSKKDGEEESPVEDKDVTNPQSKKYNTVNQDHRKDPEAKKPTFSGGDLTGFDGSSGNAGADANKGNAKMKKVTPSSKGGKKK